MDVRAFWDSRAHLGPQAGTRDLLAVELEHRAIEAYVKPGQRILDVGCGNGSLAIQLVAKYGVQVTGVDYSGAMIEAAITNRDAFLGEREDHPNPLFVEGNVLELPKLKQGDIRAGVDMAGFDLIITKRCLINLGIWEQQAQAIRNICALLKVGGQYAMCENSANGVAYINQLRACLDLPAVVPPAHNRYLYDHEVAGLRIPNVVLTKEDDYSATYYFLSRCVNAALAAAEGKEPEYDSFVNRLALKLPSLNFAGNREGIRGQGRIWVWERFR